MNPTQYNYASIDVYVRNANRLRSEAVGEMLGAAWRGIKRIASWIQGRHDPNLS